MKNKYLAAAAAAAAGLCFCQRVMAAFPAAAESAAGAASDSRAVGIGFAAALTMAFSVLGSAYAVGRIGAAAMGAAAEKPELLIRSLLFVALAEGLAVLGFVISMLLLGKI
jgi:V/A-type H+-transporting ATPase subunit K